jgi:hypothetical protein
LFCRQVTKAALLIIVAAGAAFATPVMTISADGLKPGFYAGDDLTGDMVSVMAPTEVTGFRPSAQT